MKDISFHDYVVHDLLEGIPGVTSRAMFSGWGIYKDGVFFALISEGELYFKVGKNNQADFEAVGSHPFVYEGHKGKKITMSYWLVPEEILEHRGKLLEFVDGAVVAAEDSKKKK